MVLYSQIDDIVTDIKSGKLDLTEVITDYEKKIDELNQIIEENNAKNIRRMES